jgi:hypothetical protein
MASPMMPGAAREERGYYVVAGCGGNIAWHTEDDTLEIAERDVLAKDIGLCLAAVLRLANDEILPIDWRAMAAEFSQVIADYRKAAGARFDLSPAATAELGAAPERFHADPALNAPPPERMGFALIQPPRGRNRLVAAPWPSPAARARLSCGPEVWRIRQAMVEQGRVSREIGNDRRRRRRTGRRSRPRRDGRSVPRL